MARRIDDLDQRDLQTRLAIRAQLRARREQLGMSQQALGDLLSTGASNVRRLERQGVDQSYTTTIMKWARMLGLRLAITPVGFPPPARVGADRVDDLLAAVSGQMHTVGGTDNADQWEVTRLMRALSGIRVACAVTQRQMAARMGVCGQAASLVEISGSSTALVVLQRHARAIARCSRRSQAYLDVRLDQPGQADAV